MIFHPIIPTFLCIVCWLATLSGLAYCIVSKPQRNVKNFRRISIIIMLVILMMRPAITEDQTDSIERKLNIFFVADFTGSMAARDGSGNIHRYEQVKSDVAYIAEQFPGARYSLISLAQTAQINSPLSSDLDTLKDSLKALTPPETFRSKCSPLRELLDFSTTKISRYAKVDPDYQNIIFIMSDGEDTEEEVTTISEDLPGIIDGGMVLGYGTSEGTTIDYIDKNGPTDTPVRITNKENHTSTTPFSKRNDRNLENIAANLNIEYNPRTSMSLNENDFKKIAEKADTVVATSDTKTYHEGYWIAALGLAALLAWEFYYVLTELMRERKHKK